MILITRPKKDSFELQRKLKQKKIFTKVQELSSFKISNTKIGPLKSIVLITSPRAIDYIRITRSVKAFDQLKFIVIGKKTKNKLIQLGCTNILFFAKNSSDLIDKVSKYLNKNAVINFLCSNVYNKDLVKDLRLLNFRVKLHKVYETIAVKKLNPTTIKNLREKKFKGAIFYSRFSLEIFLRLSKLSNIALNDLKCMDFICFSSRIARPAVKLGLNVMYPDEPSESTLLILAKRCYTQRRLEF